jgi:hypothetical protein
VDACGLVSGSCHAGLQVVGSVTGFLLLMILTSLTFNFSLFSF